MVGVGGGNSNCIKLLCCVILDFLHYFATSVYLVLSLLFSFFFYFWSSIIFLLASQNVDGLTSNLLLYLTFALFCLFLLYYDYYYLSKEIFPKLKLQGKDQQFFIVFFSGDSYMETYCKFYFTYFYDFKDCFYLLSGFYCAECIMSLEYFNGIVLWQRLLLMGLNPARIRSPLFQEDYAVCDNLYSATYKECFYIDF